ncbi:MAG: response regulator [Planctomycetota bacterium]|jgi:DNA-binding NarL/FixJ family response regulator
MDKPTIILADDHTIVLEGLKSLLENEFEVVATALNGRELIEKAEQYQPTVIVVDIAMPYLNGIDAVRQIRKTGSEAKIVFLTMHRDPMYAKGAFDAGASGFVLKHSAASELVTAIREALRNNTFVSPAIAGDVMRSYKDESDGKGDPIRRLTLRQREILQLLAEGRSAKEIAFALKLSVRTVEFHKYNVMQELGITTNAGLVRFAIKNGLVSI